MKKIKLLAVCALSAALLVGCGSKKGDDNSGVNNNGSEVSENANFTGTKIYETLYDSTGKKGDVVVVNVDFKDGQATKVSLDVIQEDGSSKKEAAANGEYVMVEDAEYNWGEQIELLENTLNENGVDISKINISTDQGNTDAISGVSIKVKTYLDVINEVVNSVKNGTELPSGFTGVKVSETDPSGENKETLVTKVVFNHGEPVTVTFDTLQKDGSSKKEAAADGKYVMVEGSEFHWGEQIEMLETFIAENNFDLSKVTLTNDEGNTDAISGVSIKVGTLLQAVQDILDSVK